jgi:hypothetical protein
MKGMNMDAFGVSKAEKEIARSSGNPSGGRRAASFFGGGYHTIASAPKGRRIKNVARDMGSSALGSLPGAAVGTTGAGLMIAGAKAAAPELEAGADIAGKFKGKKALIAGLPLVLAGGAMTPAGAQIGRQMNLTRANRKGYLKAEEKEKVGKSSTLSAFGVEHNEEISKLSFKPITQGFKALKFGNAKTLPKTMGQSYKSGIASGQGKFNSGVNAAAVGIKHSPGIAAAGAGLGVTGVGGAGYAMGRRKD